MGLGLAHRLDQVSAEAFPRDRAVVAVRAPRRLPPEVLHAAVELRRAVGLGGFAHRRDRLVPFLAVLAEDPELRAHVLGALGVVGREPGHRVGERRLLVGRPGVEARRGEGEPGGGGADLGQREQVGPAVVGGVLDALGHHGAARLLEAGDEFAARRLVRASRAADLEALEQVDDDLEGLVALRVEDGSGAFGGGVDRLDGVGGGRSAGDDVGAVAAEGREHGAQAVVEGAPGVVAEAHVGGADGVGERGEAVGLARERHLDDLALGLVDHRGEGAHGVAGDAVHRAGERGRARGVAQERADAPGGVVPRRARGLPRRGEGLLVLEDLLDDDPGVVRGVGEAREVAGRVGEAVGVVDAQAVEGAVAHEVDHEAVGGVEDLGILDAERDEGADVEEAAVVELLVGDAPVGEAVVLLGDEGVEGERFGAGADGEDVVVVAEDGDLAAFLEAGDGHRVERELAGGEDGADALAEDGHEDGVAAGPVDVEPVREGGVGALGEHGPEGAVVVDGRRDGHVVGDEVRDEAHVALVGGFGEGAEAFCPAEDGGDVGVVDDVVEVGGAGGGAEDGAQVEVGDAQGLEIREAGGGVGEGEAFVELEPVGREGDRGVGPVPEPVGSLVAGLAAVDCARHACHCARVRLRAGFGGAAPRPARFSLPRAAPPRDRPRPATVPAPRSLVLGRELVALAPAEAWRARGIDSRRRHEAHRVIPNLDLPAVAVQAMVTSRAQQHPVAQVGGPGVSFPPANMVGLAPGWRRVAPGASAVAFDEREALRGGEQPARPPPVEDLGCPRRGRRAPPRRPRRPGAARRRSRAGARRRFGPRRAPTRGPRGSGAPRRWS